MLIPFTTFCINLCPRFNNIINAKLEIRRDVSESKGFRLSRTKTECMEFEFGKSRNKDKGVVTLDDQEIPKSES